MKIDQREVDLAIKQIEKIPIALRDDVRKKILRKAAQPIIQVARSKVPIDTGNLSRSIGILSLRKSDNVYVGPRTNKSSRRDRKTKRGDGWYGHFVEFGTKKAKSQPYMRPAYEQTKGQVLKIIIDGVRDALAKHLKNGSGR